MNTKLIHAIADALIGEYGEEATEWLEDGGRANVERILGEWRAQAPRGRRAEPGTWRADTTGNSGTMGRTQTPPGGCGARSPDRGTGAPAGRGTCGLWRQPRGMAGVDGGGSRADARHSSALLQLNAVPADGPLRLLRMLSADETSPPPHVLAVYRIAIPATFEGRAGPRRR